MSIKITIHKEKHIQEGIECETGDNCGFDDCNETGAGKVLLQLLTQTIKQHRAESKNKRGT